MLLKKEGGKERKIPRVSTSKRVIMQLQVPRLLECEKSSNKLGLLTLETCTN